MMIEANTLWFDGGMENRGGRAQCGGALRIHACCIIPSDTRTYIIHKEFIVCSVDEQLGHATQPFEVVDGVHDGCDCKRDGVVELCCDGGCVLYVTRNATHHAPHNHDITRDIELKVIRKAVCVAPVPAT